MPTFCEKICSSSSCKPFRNCLVTRCSVSLHGLESLSSPRHAVQFEHMILLRYRSTTTPQPHRQRSYAFFPSGYRGATRWCSLRGGHKSSFNGKVWLSPQHQVVNTGDFHPAARWKGHEPNPTHTERLEMTGLVNSKTRSISHQKCSSLWRLHCPPDRTAEGAAPT